MWPSNKDIPLFVGVPVIMNHRVYMDERTFILLYKSMVRPHVKFGNSVWCPCKTCDLKEIEKIRKRATNL